jgi:hypothetical protein
MQEPLTNLLNLVGLAWWVEITTEMPRCTYYFGPFGDYKSAEASKAGYLEDLQQEGAQGIGVRIKRCKPFQLTISDDLVESNGHKPTANTTMHQPASVNPLTSYETNP